MVSDSILVPFVSVNTTFNDLVALVAAGCQLN
jgi:hypothetical protein